jgi:hypothetical protein
MDHNHPDRELDVDVGQRFRHLRTPGRCTDGLLAAGAAAMSTSIEAISPNGPNPDHIQHREHPV